MRAIARLAGGGFAVAGQSLTGNFVSRRVGSAWQPIPGLPGTSVHFPVSPLELDNGDLLAGGNFSGALMRWNGAAWSSVGFPGAAVYALARAGDGAILVGGENAVHRWDGTAWQVMGSGFSGAQSTVSAFATLPDGELVIGGSFTVANGLDTFHVALVTTTCPASAIPSGTGCVGAGGQNTLVTTALPWAGGTFRAQAGGMPMAGACASVFGFSGAQVPLSTLLSQGLPGCWLLAPPDLVAAGLPSGGTFATALAIPDSVTLAGLVLHHQVVSIELDAAGSITALSSTPKLVAILGAF